MPTPGLSRLSDALFRACLAFAPRDFRDEHRVELFETLAARERDVVAASRATARTAPQASRSLWRFRAREAAALLRAAWRLRHHTSHSAASAATGDLMSPDPGAVHTTSRGSVGRAAMLPGLAGDLRLAMRSLAKHRMHSAVAVLTLMVAVGAATAVFSVLNAVIIRPLPYPEADRLVVIRDSSPRFPVFNVSPGRFLEWQRRGRVFDGIAAANTGSISLTGDGEPERVPVGFVSANLFSVLGVQPMAGRTFTEDEDRANGPRAIILSESLWQSRFGARADIIGQRIVVNELPATVVGVMPAVVQFPGLTTRAWMPLAFTDQQRANDGSHYLRVVGRTAAGVPIDAARRDLERAARELAELRPDANRTWTVLVDSMHGLMIDGVRQGIWLLVAAAGAVLVIACANVAGLLLARGADRQREFAVRSALGASRWRLARQLLVESLALGVVGAAGGVVLAMTLLRVIVALPWLSIPRVTEPPFDATSLAFAAALALVTPVLFGLVPAWQIANPSAGLALASGGRSGGTSLRARTRAALIVGEVALAVMLVAGSALLLRSLDRLLRVEPGFAPAGLMAVGVSLPATRYDTDAARAGFFAGLVEQASAIPGADRVAVANPIPFLGEMMSGIHIDGIEDSADQRPPAHFYAVTPGYFQTMGIPLLRGRDIAPTDRADAPRVALVSRRLAETLFSGRDALGRQIRIGQGPRRDFAEIIGVVDDVRHRDLDGASTLQVYEPLAQHPYFGTAQLVVRSSLPADVTLGAVRQTLGALDPLLPTSGATSLDRAIAGTTGSRRFTTTLLAALAGIALLLAAVGIYGLVSFSVGRRVQEFGLRMALGAEPKTILRMVLREGLSLAVAGVALGVAGSLLLGRLLETLLFEVSPRDPLAIVAAAVVLVLATLVACHAPARKALRVSPVTALRQS